MRGIQPNRLLRSLPFLIAGTLLAAVLLNWAAAVFGRLPAPLTGVTDWISGFAAVFMGIFFEAAPFLLLGTLASGLVAVFLSREDLARWIPHGGLRGVLSGASLGLFFPVCECGVVPFARRLINKGMRLPAAFALILAAPVVNPVVIASTYAAFGNSAVLWGRVGFSFLIAVLSGLLIGRLIPGNLLRSDSEQNSDQETDHLHTAALKVRLQQALVFTADEFFEMGRFLVMGALLAALLQSILPQSIFLAVGRGPVLSVLVLIAVAFLLSICSTVDAFVALAFAATFSPGAVIAFLVFGPMVDIKSTLLYYRVFKPRAVWLLVMLPFLFSLLVGVGWNLWVK